MLDELDRALATAAFEDDGFLVVAAFERDGDRAALRFDLHTGVDGEPPERWRVDCHGVEAFALSGGLASGLDVADDDPAL